MLLKFHPKQFEKGGAFAPKGWHLLNDAQGQQGEFTLCGVAFDGDATSRACGYHEPQYKKEGKVTCPNCIAIIKLCKSAKY